MILRRMSKSFSELASGETFLYSCEGSLVKSQVVQMSLEGDHGLCENNWIMTIGWCEPLMKKHMPQQFCEPLLCSFQDMTLNVWSYSQRD